MVFSAAPTVATHRCPGPAKDTVKIHVIPFFYIV